MILHIAGGNLYQVTEKDGIRTYETLRKPDDLQEQMWKEVYPARRLVLATTPIVRPLPLLPDCVTR